jgi:hypothetical protein
MDEMQLTDSEQIPQRATGRRATVFVRHFVKNGRSGRDKYKLIEWCGVDEARTQWLWGQLQGS